MNLSDLLDEVRAWTQHNFPRVHESTPILGMVEEGSELAEALLESHMTLELVSRLGSLVHLFIKSESVIRYSMEENLARQKDAIGDLFIFLCHYTILRGWDLNAIIEHTWSEVRKRDWTVDPMRAGSAPDSSSGTVLGPDNAAHLTPSAQDPH